jgi:hypothetical protein
MPLSLFDHNAPAHYREKAVVTNPFGHTFGGELSEFGIRCINLEQPLHVLYHLNLSDPAVGVKLPGVKWLPLLYGFAYATYDGMIIYRVVNDTEVELIAPADPQYDPDFPYDNYPKSFPQSAVSFAREPYDPTIAEDALSLAAVFGVDRLSEREMQRAVAIIEREGWRTDEFYSARRPQDFIRSDYRLPFMQGAPSKSCDNPECTAEIAYRTEPMEITLPEEFAELVGGEPIRVEASEVRRDSMRVFALHQPESDDELMWGDPFVQLIFEICDVCHCIRVSNQCT